MATGHILPGYGEPVTRLRRARSAGCYPLDSSTLFELKNAAKLAQREFDSIRENTRNAWLKNGLQPTTYDTFFCDGEVHELTPSRPSSSYRRNKPHPPPVFLTNRLHYIEGYHNPDATLGKSVYKIDASLSHAAQAQRRAPRLKYVARPDSAIVNSFKDPYGFKNVLPPREAQAAEAWVKLADDEDRDNVMEVINQHAGILNSRDASCDYKANHPSLHRWMKLAGAEENGATNRIMKTLQSNPMGKGQYERCTYTPQSVGEKRREDIASNGLYKFNPRLRRGDYSMHPEWPTSLPHHRVP